MGVFDDQVGNRADDDRLSDWLRSRIHPSETELAVCRAGEVASLRYRSYVLGLTSTRLLLQPTDRRGALVGSPRSLFPHQVGNAAVWSSGATRRALLAGSENQLQFTLTTGQPFRLVPLHGVSFEEHLVADPQLAVVWSFVDWLVRAEGAARRMDDAEI